MHKHICKNKNLFYVGLKKSPLLEISEISTWITHHQVVKENEFFSRKSYHATVIIKCVHVTQLKVWVTKLFPFTLNKRQTVYDCSQNIRYRDFQIRHIIFFILHVIWNFYGSLTAALLNGVVHAALLNEVQHAYKIILKHIKFLFSPWFYVKLIFISICLQQMLYKFSNYSYI